MDPLSLTASIVALVQIVGFIGTALRKIQTLHHSSYKILSLVYTASDLQAVLAEVEKVVIQYQATANLPTETISSLSRIVLPTTQHLLDRAQVVTECGGRTDIFRSRMETHPLAVPH